MTAAERQVQDDLANRREVVEPNVFERRVEQVADYLREHHECNNHIWLYRPGGGVCRQCHHDLPAFLMVRANSVNALFFVEMESSLR